MTTLQRLQDWYKAQCNDDWEHQYGVHINTLDNPGWLVKIDLTDTHLGSVEFDPFEDQYDDEFQWLRCWTQDGQFHAACGPDRLEDALKM
jgi:Immunity protein 53